MNIRNIAFLAAAACAALVGAADAGPAQRTAGRQSPVSPLPEIKKDCALCHLVDGNGKPKELKKALSRLCLDCHSDRSAPAEHKVGIAPTVAVKELPLTDGKMTCATCHDPHANANGSMLRMSATALCLVCHPK